MFWFCVEYQISNILTTTNNIIPNNREAIRELWKHYYKDTQGLVFVIDSNDKRRFKEVNEKIVELNNEVELKSLPFLVFANKQDLPDALNARQLSETLNLESIFQSTKRKWNVVECQASVNDDGLTQGFKWLLNPNDGATPNAN